MKKIMLILLVIVPLALYSQPPVFQQEQYPFPLSFNNFEPLMGFHNSYVYYRQDFADIDNDGDFDFIFGLEDYVFLYKNIGYPSLANYSFITSSLVELIPQAGTNNSPCFCDIDNDGDLDLFEGSACRIVYYQNIGTPDSAAFIIADSSFTNTSYYCHPTLDFIDIDDDGDYDLFLGFDWSDYDGRLYFYRNIGTPEIPIMSLESTFFEGIDVGNASAPEFCDINNDNDYDLFIGDKSGTVWYYENIGNSVNYDFQYVTSNYLGIDVGNMSVPRFCDIDADEDYDLFVGNESVGFSNAMEGDFTFYRNDGTAANPDFTFITGQYLFMDMSAGAQPYYIDIDDDSLKELLVGIVGGPVVLFENQGTLQEPNLFFSDSSLFNWVAVPRFSFGDLDDDGDYDAIVAQASFIDNVVLYMNTGTPMNPIFTNAYTIATQPSPTYCYTGVELCDIDNDGDLDLFIGENCNRIYFWENTGSQTHPQFTMITNNYFNQSYLQFYYQYPRFGDFDHDGDFDMIVGYHSYSGVAYGINYWTNMGNAFNDSLVLTDTIAFWEGDNLEGAVYPCLGDVDNDGDLDMFLGDAGGALLFYRNLENPYQTELTISLSGSDVILTWQTIPGAEQYRIFYADSCYFTPAGTPQGVVLPPDTSFIDAGAAGVWGQRFYRMVVGY